MSFIIFAVPLPLVIQQNVHTKRIPFTIDVTENITPKKFFMKPFVKRYLKKQQAAYIRDLTAVLEAIEHRF